MRSTATHRRTLTAVAVSAVVAVAAIWVAAITLATADRRDVLRDAETELIGTQNAIAAQVERTFENARFLLTAVDLWLADPSNRRPLDQLATWMAALESVQEAPLSVHLVDEAGNVVRYGDQRDDAVNVRDRDYYEALQSLSPKFLYVGAQVMGRESGRNIIPLATKVSPNRFAISYAVVSIPTQGLIEAFDGLLVTAPGTVGIIREDGTFLLRTPDPEGATGRKVDLSQILGLTPDSPRIGFLTQRLLDGKEAMTAYSRLNSLPLYVYGTFKMSDLLAKADDRARPKILAAGLATVAVTIGAGLLGLLILQREREAKRVADALVAADEANAAKTQFLANVSHELRTPLNAVIGFSETLAAQIFGPLSARYQGYAEDILSSGRHLLSIVDQLLDMASIEARREHLRPEAVQIADIADEVAQMMRPMADQRGVRLVVHRPAEPITIETDSRCVRQILINLMSNGIRFCRAGNEVTLSWARDGASVGIVVQDQGPGIEEEDLPRIFDLFWQGEDAYARRHRGIGLGLPLTRTLTTALGGTISVTSELGVGSRFVVRLPDALPA